MLQDQGKTIEKRPAKGGLDYSALALTTFGVGYIPGAPGTYGSAVGVGIYLLVVGLEAPLSGSGMAPGLNVELLSFMLRSALVQFYFLVNAIALVVFMLVGI